MPDTPIAIRKGQEEINSQFNYSKQAENKQFIPGVWYTSAVKSFNS